MRLLAAALAAALCAFIGFMRAGRAQDRLKLINSFLSDIRKLSMQIEFTSDPICIIMDKISASSELSAIWNDILYCMNDGMTCKDAWDAATKNQDELLAALEREELTSLSDFFSTLGKTDKNTEKKNAEYAYKLLEDISARLNKKTEDSVKLCKSVGLLTGIGFAILII